MLQYVNGFSCALNNKINDFVIEFLQTSPTFEDDNDNEAMCETVVSLVMPKEVAENLSKALLELLHDSDEEISTENIEHEK